MEGIWKNSISLSTRFPALCMKRSQEETIQCSVLHSAETPKHLPESTEKVK